MYASFLSKVSALPSMTAATGAATTTSSSPVSSSSSSKSILAWGIDAQGNGGAEKLLKVYAEGLRRQGRDGITSTLVEQFKPSPAIEEAPSGVDGDLSSSVVSPACSVFPFGTLRATEDNGEEFSEVLRKATREVAKRNIVPLTFGGASASITEPIVTSLSEELNQEIVVVRFSSSEPSPGIKALSSSRRQASSSPSPSPMKGLLHFGTRALDRTAKSARRSPIPIQGIDMRKIAMEGVHRLGQIPNKYPLYLSVDLSALDPQYAPGVMSPEPAGLNTRELFRLLELVSGPRIVGLEITGYEPSLDGALPGRKHSMTELTAASIAHELVDSVYRI